MSKHTPGPWRAFRNGVYSAELDAVHNGKTCAECGHSPAECGPAVFVAIAPELIEDIKDGWWDDAENPKEADMRLIAAAPDLLEVLNLYSLPLSGDYKRDCFEFGEREVDRELSRRAAIAKATGEE